MDKIKENKLRAKINTLPSFEALELDSTTIFNTSQLEKGLPVVILYFSPDCHLCHEETKMITKYIEDFNRIQILMLSLAGTAELKKFSAEYKLSYYKNIRVLKDTKYSMINVFELKTIPSAVIYGDDNQIKKIFERAPDHQEIIDILSI